MSSILILRAEIICFIIMLFLLISSLQYMKSRESRVFYRLWTFAMIHLIAGAAAVVGVNSREMIPPLILYAVEIALCLSGMMFAKEFFHYTVALCLTEKWIRRAGGVSVAAVIVYIVSLPFMSLRYVEGIETDYASGSVIYTAFFIALCFIILSVLVLVIKRRETDRHAQLMLLPMAIVMILIEVVQLKVEEIQCTGLCVTIITVAVFFTMENPVMIMHLKAMMDIMTGMYSRNSFEADFEMMEADYHRGSFKNGRIAFVFCDINGLKLVNDTYGHQIGDEYIGTVARALKEGLSTSRRIYRMGGDEFLAVYYNARENRVKKEIEHVREKCDVASSSVSYKVSVAIGYCLSGENYASLKEVLDMADREMYRQKRIEKNSLSRGAEGMVE